MRQGAVWLAKHKMLFAAIMALVYIVSGLVALWAGDLWDVWWAIVAALVWAYMTGMIVFVMALRRFEG